MNQTVYREEGKTKCPACQREVAAVRVRTHVVGDALVSRHLYQEQVELNEIGAPTVYTDGFCPGSFHPANEVIRNGR